MIIAHAQIHHVPDGNAVTMLEFQQQQDFSLMAPTASIATCGWLMMGVPIKLPNVPTLVNVKVPPCVSSGFNLLLRALSASAFTCLVIQPDSTGQHF